MSDEPEEPDEKSGSRGLISAGSLVFALLTAILSGAVSYAFGVVSDIRKTKINFVNEQIQKLYGSLYAESQASDAVWGLFNEQRWKDPAASPVELKEFFNDAQPPTVEQVRRWRRWMRNVYQPLNVGMENAITANTQLLVGDNIPIALSTLIAHTEAYKAVIVGWGADEDLKDCETKANSTGVICPALTTFRNTSGVNYPDSVVECVASDYLQLKKLRDELEAGFLKVFSTTSLERSAACDKQFRSSGVASPPVSPHP